MQLALHRHLSEHAVVEPHQHRWSQALLYLTGAGEQMLGEERIPVSAGSLVIVRPGTPHAFVRCARRSPLCLMIDFRLSGSSRRSSAACALTKAEIARVREVLVRLIKLEESSPDDLRWQGAVLVLELLTLFLHAAGWYAAPRQRPESVARQTLGQLLESIDPNEKLVSIIRRSGYQRDHLNRLVKAQTGLSLGQYLARSRIQRAEQLLREGLRVSEVATLVGMPDQGYFARWFRKQTGNTPTAWISNAGAKHANPVARRG